MIIAPDVSSKYNFSKGYYEHLKKIVDDEFGIYLKLHRDHFYTSRIKELDSLCEKIETGRFGSYSDIDDVFACTIVVPNKSDFKSVCDFIKERFTIIVTKDRTTGNIKASSFVFDSMRIYTILKHNILHQLAGLSFEIQVRTFFEHAWSISVHPIMYKSEFVEWKIDRLCYSIKASIEQIDMLLNKAKEVSASIAVSADEDYKCVRFIYEKVTDLFQQGLLDETKLPKDYSRFCQNVYQLFSACSIFKTNRRTTSVKKLWKLLYDYIIENRNRIPESLSLIQMFICILLQSDVEIDSKSYKAFISQEMKTLYPATKLIDSSFSL